ncbi:MAG: hypothetical protein RUDDFDWM_001557 [Candidatus Fervidibacterota bacterium]
MDKEMGGVEGRANSGHSENAFAFTRVGKKEKWLLYLRIAFSLSLFVWVLILGYKEGMFGKLHGLHVTMVLMCVVIYCSLQSLSALNWWVIALATGVRIRFVDALMAFFVGMFFNLFLPGVVGGDIVRAYIASKRSYNLPLSRVIGTVYAQRSTGFVALVALGCVAAVWLGKAVKEVVIKTLLVFFILLVVASSSIAVLLIWRNSKSKWKQRLARFSEGAVLFLSQPWCAAVAFAIAILYHLCLDAMLFWVGSSVGMKGSYPLYVAMVSSLTAISSIPIAIHGLGIREITAAHLWALTGVSTESAILWSLLWRLITWLAALPGGLIYLGLMASGLKEEILKV